MSVEDGMPGFDVGFVIFPQLTLLDFAGPFEVPSRLGTPPSVSAPSRLPPTRVHVAARTMAPVMSDRGLAVLPTCTFEDCPPLDLICVPGGGGIAEALGDPETVGFVRRQAQGATYVCSVCMGAFLLGAAGLLQGRRAATHWAYVDLLPLVGATHANGRVVQDGRIYTSGGVTAGIDFSFRILADLAGADVAQAVQLGIEYDPAPPFDAGHPAKASEAAIALMVQRNAGAHAEIRRRLEGRAP